MNALSSSHEPHGDFHGVGKVWWHLSYWGIFWSHSPILYMERLMKFMLLFLLFWVYLLLSNTETCGPRKFPSVLSFLCWNKMTTQLSWKPTVAAGRAALLLAVLLWKRGWHPLLSWSQLKRKSSPVTFFVTLESVSFCPLSWTERLLPEAWKCSSELRAPCCKLSETHGAPACRKHAAPRVRPRGADQWKLE